MPKLITPVQFEPSLEGLNIVRPLIMPDECKTIISYPVLCQNLPSEGKPGVGKLARCTQSGALLRDNSELPDKVYDVELEISENGEEISYTFPTKVVGVIAQWEDEADVIDFWWCSSDYSVLFVELRRNDFVFLPFSGKTIHFFVDSSDGWDIELRLIGFYR